jgi:hypothetical protein
MPRLSVVAIRLALLYFLAGLTFGALLLANKGIPLHPALWSLLPLHIEFLLFGWIVQLVLAVAYWIFPRLAGDLPRGNPRLAAVAILLLNLGVLAVAAASLAASGAWLFAGRLLELAALLTFALHLWSRIRPTAVGRSVS